MTEFARGTAFPAQNASVREDASSQSFGDIDDHQVMHSVTVAEPDFRQGTRIGDIIGDDWQSGGLFDTGLDVRDGPADIWREDGLVGARPARDGLGGVEVKTAGQTYPNAIERAVHVNSDDLLDCTYDGRNHFLGIFRKGNLALRNDFSTQVRYRQRGLGRMNIQSKYTALAVYVKEGGPAATGKVPHGPFNYPTLSEQLLDNE
jgi:hypothetical protein